MRVSALLLLLSVVPSVGFAASAPASALVDIATARQSLAGKWEGSLEYRDYTANKWFGIPVKTAIEDQGDGATMIRKSDFDDGPKVGIVRITSVELFDAGKGMITTATFRKGRTPSLDSLRCAFTACQKTLRTGR